MTDIYTYLDSDGGKDFPMVPIPPTLEVPANFDFVSSGAYTDIVTVNFRAFTASQGVPDTFFGIDELANGLLIQVLDDQDQIRANFGTDDFPIKTHHDLNVLAGVDVDRVTATAKSALSVEWNLLNSGRAIKLEPGWIFRIVVQDDLSTIPELRVMVQGASETFRNN